MSFSGQLEGYHKRKGGEDENEEDKMNGRKRMANFHGEMKRRKQRGEDKNEE